MTLSPQLQKGLAAFEHASNLRMSNANAANSPRQSLFHYTSEAALASILKSEQFWFTSIYYMDDPEELAFGLGVARSLLQAARTTGSGLVRPFCQVLLEEVTVTTLKEILAFYSMSFGLRDDIQQWKEYGDHGRGVAFGLEQIPTDFTHSLRA
jgi:hypothetical protein